MELSQRNLRLFIIAIIFILSVFTLWMRLLPTPQLISGNNYLLGQEPDISYNLRLIEQLLENFPTYPWFEAMTKYPFGTEVRWGPMFTYIVTVACIVSGAVTRADIAAIAFIIPPILAVVMITVMYWTGRLLSDWKTGLLSAGFVSIVSGQFVYRSLYGFADHHVAEVLFSTVFCLSYIAALIYCRSHEIDLKNPGTLQAPLLLGILSGVCYLLGLFTMPTMILFALIVTIFTVIQFTWNHLTNRRSDYLVFLNIVTFVVVSIGLLLFGIKDYSLYFIHYTPAHLLAYLAIIVGSAYLYGLSFVLKGKTPLFILALIGAVVILGGILFIAVPSIYVLIFGGIFQFFGESATTFTIQEMRPWAIGEAWFTFHFGLLLAIGGLFMILYQNYIKEKPEHIFVFVWGTTVLISTFRHVRYEYYLGPVIALLAAIFTGLILSFSWKDTWAFVAPTRSTIDVVEEKIPPKKKGKSEKKKTVKKTFDPLIVFLFFFTAALALLFIGMSLNYNYQVGSTMGYNTMHPDWRETLEWMENNTPHPGVDYLSIYEKATFRYPSQSYGVMSWWDYGHWITFFAKRIPHANPFQEGVDGPEGAASFFIAPDEDQSISIANNLTTRFVITDIEMDTGKFWAMATWYNSSLADAPYHQVFFITSPEDPLTYEAVSLATQEYYLTMISRLHNFDGSMTPSSIAYYIEYRDGSEATRNIPVVINVEVMNASDAIQKATTYNMTATMGYHATVRSTSLTSPISTVPALQHFRLIHESATNTIGNNGDIRYVKAFEYVKGARIKGEGIIEIPVLTNGGRTFLYRQESTNGEFIVPYPTVGGPYDVKATGPYRINGTSIEFAVSEEAVQKGLSIN